MKNIPINYCNIETSSIILHYSNKYCNKYHSKSTAKVKQNMETAQHNKEITIAGFEVNTRSKSHKVPTEVMRRLRAHMRQANTKEEGYAALGLGQTAVEGILLRKTCQGATLEKLIIKLFPEQ